MHCEVSIDEFVQEGLKVGFEQVMVYTPVCSTSVTTAENSSLGTRTGQGQFFLQSDLHTGKEVSRFCAGIWPNLLISVTLPNLKKIPLS